MLLVNRGLYRFIVGLVILLLAPMSFSAVKTTDLQELELNIWNVRSGYYLYSVMGGDKSYEESLQESITKAEASYNNIAQKVEDKDGNDAEFLQKLDELWPELLELANQNTIAELGYTDSYLAIDLNNQAADIIELLSEHNADGSTSDLLTLAIKSQRMTSEYLSLAAAPDGGMSTGEGNIRIDFDEAVPEFDALLAEAKKKYENNDAVTRALQQVDRKWRFIRESMVKFYEDSVPFLVSRYSEQIVDLIEQVAE